MFQALFNFFESIIFSAEVFDDGGALYSILMSQTENPNYLSLGNYLVFMLSLISLIIIIVLCCLFVYKIIKLVGNLIR